MAGFDFQIGRCRHVGPQESRDKVLSLLEILELPVDPDGPNGISFERLDEADWPLVEVVMELVNRRFPMA